MLHGKVAAIYGAGSIGSAVARRSRPRVPRCTSPGAPRPGSTQWRTTSLPRARPIESIVRSTFLTSQATARHMVRQGSGVILIFGGEGDPMRDYWLGGTLVDFHAQETMRRQLACELGPHGVRVVTSSPTASPRRSVTPIRRSPRALSTRP